MFVGLVLDPEKAANCWTWCRSCLVLLSFSVALFSLCSSSVFVDTMNHQLCPFKTGPAVKLFELFICIGCIYEMIHKTNITQLHLGALLNKRC